jgi:hypothetical protein
MAYFACTEGVFASADFRYGRSSWRFFEEICVFGPAAIA